MSTNTLRQRFRKTSYSITLGVVGLFLISASFLLPTASALTLDANRDCDANAVIHCGALSTQELQQKYDNNREARIIFNHFGISRQEVSQLGTTAVAGIVTRDGNVTVDGEIVATDAITAGRQNIAGSTPATRNGVQFYVRAPSVSFQTQRLKAFVVMKNDKFAFAIIASCGNPVKAQPKQPVHPPTPIPPPTTPTKPTPTPPTPQPPEQKPTPPPPAAQQQQQNQSQQQNASATANATANVTVNQPPAEKVEQPPTPQPETKTIVERVEVPVPITVEQPPVTTTAAAPQELPKTGMENVSTTLSISGIATLVGTLVHFIYTRRKLFS